MKGIDNDQEKTKIAWAKAYGADDSVLRRTWENFVTDEHNEKALAALSGITPFGPIGAYIFGPPGVGKSHIAKAIFNTILDWRVRMSLAGEYTEYNAYWITAAAFLDSLRVDSIQPRIKSRCFDSTVLFIDDLGATGKTEWVVDQIFQLIDHRTEREMQTFITSNLTLEELAERYTERISSRIRGAMIPIPLNGNDKRTDKMKKNFATVTSLSKRGSYARDNSDK
jgi:DNA replication protein DnaC